ncbi:MAG TPA: ABC transporter substrate-binding protein, partial [Candidatus Deferrimicrobium sp.]|nr:ABC transporter substrate-binding protein [Candidatus Deferrimicrobium sp.]
FRRILAWADDFTAGRVLFTLGGGYSFSAAPRVWAILYLVIHGLDVTRDLPETWRSKWSRSSKDELPHALHDPNPSHADIPNRYEIAHRNRQVAERERVPYVASSSLDQRLTQRGNLYFFRISRLEPFVDATTAVPLELLPAKDVAILFSATPGATQLARLQRERLEAHGVRVSAFESFQTGTPDFIPLLARVKASGSRLLLMDGFFADNLVLLRQLSGQMGPGFAVVGAFGMEFPALVEQLGPLAEGAIGAIVWEPGMSLPGDLEGSRAYETGFTWEFKHPPAPLSMYGYTAARAVLAALEKASNTSFPPERDAVRDALRGTDLLLPLERLQFDEHGDPRHYEVGIFQIQNGRHVLLYPREKAAGKMITPKS